MTTAQGFVKFLELLPVMGVVQIHPHRKQYKSYVTVYKEKKNSATECHNVYWYKTAGSTQKYKHVRFVKKNSPK